MFSPFGRDASLIGREPEQNRNYWRAAIDICDGKERPEKVNISIDKSKGTITASGELPLSGTTFKKVVSFPNNVRSETIQSTLQGKTLTLSGETDPTKTDGFLSGGFGRGGFSDPFESNASKSFNDMAKNFFGSSWKDFDTSFENQAGLMERPSSQTRIRSELPGLRDGRSSVESPSLRERTRSPYSMRSSPSMEPIAIPLSVQTEPILTTNCNDNVRWEVQLKTEEKILPQQIKITVFGNTIKITGEFEKSIEIPSDVEISKIRTWIKDKSLFISGAKKQAKPVQAASKMSAPTNRLITNSADKWELHVDLGENCPDPNDLSIIVKQNFLCIYIGRGDAEKILHDRVAIPADVKPKNIQTAIKGKVLVVSAPKGLSKPTMFNSTADIDLFPGGFQSNRGDLPTSFSKMQTTKTPISSTFGMDSTFPDYSGLGNSAGSYEVIENSPKRYRVRVPVTSDLFSSSANIIIKVNGQKVTVEAKIEATDVYGNKKISKICKDVTLPADCNMKTLKTQEENNAVIISVDKNEISQPDFVPLKERQAYEGRGVNSPWTLTGSSPSPRPSSQTDAFPQPPTQDEVLPEARAESRTRKHSKNVRFSAEPPKVTQVDTDEPPSPQVAQNKATQPTPKKKGIGRMDSNDFIMAEEEDVTASLRSLTLPVLEERPASIPPDEPIEDLGVFGGSTPQIEKPNPLIRPILQKPQDFIATNEPDSSIVPLKVVNDPPQRQMATKFPNYNTDPITRTAPSPYCPFPTDNAGFPPPPPCVTGAGSATTTFGTPLMPPPAYYDSTTTRRASVDIPVEHVDDA